ncbi:hypothetical protein THASP1DRAFT_26128 [Thamnocephalis sphaerospora]|uniref:WSC domain-containing protein n=1 Tax=Thamnocephalis sphaerospora TaxID=78915 RepID=A0A4P9XJ30_9FUNG|nr:hypothetical protein THASP1DRAFT_26128 [Thamnocephalis sphaerospora]|eukprot:RKP05361.1 hypothetical protein THASP1DRAFT_26128 [Thamnocephalis sphaerospora]
MFFRPRLCMAIGAFVLPLLSQTMVAAQKELPSKVSISVTEEYYTGTIGGPSTKIVANPSSGESFSKTEGNFIPRMSGELCNSDICLKYSSGQFEAFGGGKSLGSCSCDVGEPEGSSPRVRKCDCDIRINRGVETFMFGIKPTQNSRRRRRWA